MNNFVDGHNNATNIIGKNDILADDNDDDNNDSIMSNRAQQSLSKYYPNECISTITNCLLSTSLDSENGMAQISSSSIGSAVQPIRPQPLMPTAFSYDSGYEVSPFFNYTFQYEEPNATNPDDDDDIEGFDDELISINHQFTPINTMPIHSTPIKPFNLAMQRRENILNQRQTQTLETNNNDLDFPDQYELNDLDDDVFHNPGSCPENSNVDIRTQRYSYHRPSCLLKYKNADEDSKDSSTTSSSSGRSSTPIPIPNSRRLFEESADMLDSSDCFSIRNNEDFLFSLPEAGNRMPYYHPLAPPLEPNPLPDNEVNNNNNHYHYRHQQQQQQPIENEQIGQRINRPAFGTGFQISYSMISAGIGMNRFSPPLFNRFNSRWLTGSTNFLFRFGGLSPNMFGVPPPINYRARPLSRNIGEQYFPASYQRRLLTPLIEEPYNDNYDDHNDDNEDRDYDTGSGPSMNRPNDVEQNCQSSAADLLFNMSSDSEMDDDEVDDEKPEDDFDAAIVERQNSVRQPLNGTFQIAAGHQESSSFVSSINNGSILMNVDVVPPMDRYLQRHSCPVMESTLEHNNYSQHYPIPTSFAQCSCQCSCRCCRCCSTSINSHHLPSAQPNPSSVPLPDLVMITQSEMNSAKLNNNNNNNNNNESIMNTNNTTNRNLNQHPRSMIAEPTASNRVSNINQQPQSRQIASINNNNRIKHRNTLPSCHQQVPYQNHNNDLYNSQQWSHQPGSNHADNNHLNEQRRTMSVSLPLDEENVLRAVGRELRQISAEFRQLQIKQSVRGAFSRENFTAANQSIRNVDQENEQQHPTDITTNVVNGEETENRTTINSATRLIRTVWQTMLGTVLEPNLPTDDIDAPLPLPTIRTVNNSIFYTDLPSEEIFISHQHQGSNSSTTTTSSIASVIENPRYGSNI